jgi:hypothetical protein
MEKDDKIKKQTESTNRCGKVLLLLITIIGSLVIASKLSTTTSSTVGTSLRSSISTDSIPGTTTNNNEIVLHKENKQQQQQQQKLKQQNHDITLVNQLTERVAKLDKEVRDIKQTGVIMETDPKSQEKIQLLKDATRELIIAKYGDSNKYRVQIDLVFPKSIPDYNTNPNGEYGTIIIEMASILYQPVSVYNFLELSRTFIKGAFNRNAGHVLQSFVRSKAIQQSLSFQEYSKEFPHKKGTSGYAGRPSGPDWYISIQDNTDNHGPGSQQDHNPYEADANFGFIVTGFDDVVPRIHSIPQRGFLDKNNFIQMIKYTILIPDNNDNTKFIPWIDWTTPTKEQ